MHIRSHRCHHMQVNFVCTIHFSAHTKHIVTIHLCVYVKNELTNSTFSHKKNKGNKWNVAASEIQAVIKAKIFKMREKERHTERERDMENGKMKTNTYFTVCDALQPNFGLFWILKWFDAKIIRTTSSLAPLTENNFKSFCISFFFSSKRARAPA